MAHWIDIRSYNVVFKVQSYSDGRYPPTLRIFQHVSDRNFEMEICFNRNFENGSFDWKLKRQGALFNSQKRLEGTQPPPHPSISKTRLIKNLR